MIAVSIVTFCLYSCSPKGVYSLRKKILTGKQVHSFYRRPQLPSEAKKKKNDRGTSPGNKFSQTGLNFVTDLHLHFRQDMFVEMTKISLMGSLQVPSGFPLVICPLYKMLTLVFSF